MQHHVAVGLPSNVLLAVLIGTSCDTSDLTATCARHLSYNAHQTALAESTTQNLVHQTVTAVVMCVVVYYIRV